MVTRAFTLIEALVVIGVIATLAALIVAGTTTLRKSAKVAQTSSVLGLMRSGLERAQSEGTAWKPQFTVLLKDPINPNTALWKNGTKPNASQMATFTGTAKEQRKFNDFWNDIAYFPIYRLQRDHCTFFSFTPGKDGGISRALFGDAIEKAKAMGSYGRSSWNISSMKSGLHFDYLVNTFLDAWDNDILVIVKDEKLVLISGGPNRLYDDGPRGSSELTAAIPGYPDLLVGSITDSGTVYASDNITDGFLASP